MEEPESTQETIQILGETAASADDLAALTQDIRNRGAALGERLTKPRGKVGDDAIRLEMASIAASMVALTAATEGPSSPIHPLLDDAPETSGNGRVSLADRAREAIAEHTQGEDA